MLPPEDRAPTADEDLIDGAFLDDAPESYRRLRELGPVVYLPPNRSFLLTTYDGVVRALRDRRVGEAPLIHPWVEVSRRIGRDYSPVVNLMRLMPFISSGADHAWQRRSLAVAVAPFANGGELVDRCVEARVNRVRDLDRFDFARDLSRYLFSDFVAELTGLDHEAMEAVRPLTEMSWGLDPLLSVKHRDEFCAALVPTMELLKRHVGEARGRGEPAFLATLRSALPEERRSDETVASFIAIMLLMGNDAMAACLTFPVRDLLDEDLAIGIPQTEWATISDEALRLTSPVHTFARRIREEVAFDGVTIYPDELILIGGLCGSMDPEKFGPRAHTFDPGSHHGVGLAFGAGAHVCVGNRLARATVKKAYEELSKLPALRLDGRAEMGRGSFMRRMESLPVAYA